MSSVTYLPYKDKIYITCNRDVRPTGISTLAPGVKQFTSGKILYPQNADNGGTWIGIHNNGNAMVMLNGAFAPHMSKDNYRESKEVIFLEIFDADNPVKKFNDTNLDDIEPFTLVAWLKQNGTLWEMRWDEYEKFVTSLPADVPNMWSSVTLFDEVMSAKRKKHFNHWRTKQDQITGETIRWFHEHGGEGFERMNLNINRGATHTLSITGIEMSDDRSVMYYHDLVTGEQTINGWLFADEKPEV